MSFQIHALPAELFSPLFGLDDAALKNRRAKRVTADSQPGFPCRVSLQEAEIGETVLLVNFTHQSKESPYNSTHAIFVREGAHQAHLPPNVVPENWGHRLLSLRGYDSQHDIIEAECGAGTDLIWMIETFFENSNVDYIHIHNAGPGCFAASVTRR